MTGRNPEIGFRPNIQMSSKFWSGQNVDKEIDALVDKGGIPRKLVDAYLQGRTKQETPQQQQAEAPGLEKADADNITTHQAAFNIAQARIDARKNEK